MHVKLVPMSQKINDVASTNMDRFGLKQQTVVNSCEASVQQRDGELLKLLRPAQCDHAQVGCNGSATTRLY